MEDNSDIGAGGDTITNINTPTFIGSLEAHATIKLTIDTQLPAEPTLGSTVSSLDNTVTLKGAVEAHQDIQVKVTVNDTDYTAVLITIPVTGMFLFRNPLFCRGRISTP